MVRQQIFFIILGVLFGVTHCKQQEKETKMQVDPNAPVILFLGDSLTAGFGVPVEKSFPSLVQEAFLKENIGLRVINGGRSGDTSAGGLDRLDWYLQSNLPIKHFVLCLGSNDAMRGLPLPQLEQNLNKILNRVKTEYPEAKIYISQLYTFSNLGESYTAQFEEIFPRVAQKQGATLLPFILSDVAGQAHLNQPDGIHPNEQGTQLVADFVLRELKPYLN